MRINSDNKLFWNILKGIGILSVVIGHSFAFLGPFVYLYHLPLFFFIGGYLYKEEKYGDNPMSFFISKVRSNWKRYAIYCTIIILFHNFIYGNKYHLQEFLYSICQSFFFVSPESLVASLWFVEIFIIASTIFGIIVYFSRKLINYLNIEYKETLKSILIVVFSLAFGFLGYYFMQRGLQIYNGAQKAFLIVPFFTVGYLVKKYIRDLNKILRIYIFIHCLIILIYFSFYHVIYIDLAYEKIGNIGGYYLLAIVGIYFCLYLSKIFSKLICIKDLFNNLGKYSFEIMAFHLLVFRLIDLVYFNFNRFDDYSLVNNFPYSFSELWPVYIVLGTCLPAMCFYLIDKYKGKVFKYLRIEG